MRRGGQKRGGSEQRACAVIVCMHCADGTGHPACAAACGTLELCNPFRWWGANEMTACGAEQGRGVFASQFDGSLTHVFLLIFIFLSRPLVIYSSRAHHCDARTPRYTLTCRSCLCHQLLCPLSDMQREEYNTMRRAERAKMVQRCSTGGGGGDLGDAKCTLHRESGAAHCRSRNTRRGIRPFLRPSRKQHKAKQATMRSSVPTQGKRSNSGRSH